MNARLISSALAVGVTVTGLTLTTATSVQAKPGGGAVVISEVYGGGGNSGATYTHDFVELHNPTAQPISVDGMGLEYKSAGGGSAGVVALNGTVPAGGYYLVQLARGSGGTTPLPTPDDTGSLNLSGTQGRVFLLPDTNRYAGPDRDVAGSTALVDMVGYAPEAITYETAPTPALSNSTSAARNAAGADTDHNDADFTVGEPTPKAPPATPDPDPGPEELSIAEIQGTGPSTPYDGDEVTTEGVVTAIYRDPYPSVLGAGGGYDGFYLQTGGTGDATDETPGASDAIFVYGASALTGLEIGDSVRVTGEADEFSGSTQIRVQADGVAQRAEPLPPVTPLATAYPTTTPAREAHEGELLAPTDRLTVSNVYSTNQYAEIGLATGDEPLVQPTDVARPGTAEYRAVVADNAARAVTLDDATSVNFLDYGDVEQDIPLPWLSKANPVRVGAEATLLEPVILEFRNGTWKFQPTEPVTGAGAGGDVASFEDTRDDNAAPQDVGGDIRLATFNVLNYFNTTGEDFEANGGDCSYYTDRDDEPVTVNRCEPEGPRGAADAEDLDRQQAKIVAAINGLDADVVSLEELENSVKLLGETDRDDAIAELVRALNAAAGGGTWAFVKSPDEAYDPATLDQQDVIRTGFIYRPDRVRPVGSSDILFHAAFENARQPLAQTFHPVGTPNEKFAVIVNHFKSKSCSGATGDNVDAGDGQSCYNGDRVRQAEALAAFVDGFAAARSITSVFLTGDFNSYTEEDPMQVLYDAGYGLVESDQAGDWSYSFQGHSGSLDHVLASPAALDSVMGADVWEINANESIAFQYSRHNYNATDFYERNQYAASDHNPEVVGVDASALR